MKVSWKQSADATQWQITVEAQNNEEDAILEEMFARGEIMGMGETRQEHRQLILSTRVPEWYREQRRGIERRE